MGVGQHPIVEAAGGIESQGAVSWSGEKQGSKRVMIGVGVVAENARSAETKGDADAVERAPHSDRNRYALVNLQKLHEDQHQWTEALHVREQIAKIDGGRPDDLQILGFLRNQIGTAQSREGNAAAAARAFTDAIDVVRPE